MHEELLPKELQAVSCEIEDDFRKVHTMKVNGRYLSKDEKLRLLSEWMLSKTLDVRSVNDYKDGCVLQISPITLLEGDVKDCFAYMCDIADEVSLISSKPRQDEPIRFGLTIAQK